MANTLVDFDGTNDELGGVNSTSLTNNKTGLFHLVIKPDSTGGANQSIFELANRRFRVYLSSTSGGDFNVGVNAQNTSGTTILNAETTGYPVIGDQVNHIAIAFDMAVGLIIMVNRADVSPTPSTFTNDNVEWTRTNSYFGTNLWDYNRLNAAVQSFWLNNEYLDISDVSNLNKFIYESGYVADLGANGSTPTGNQPAYYLKDDNTSFETNYGILGNFTVTGALTDEGSAPQVPGFTATERLAPTAIEDSLNLDGAVTDIDDDPDSPDANWLTLNSANGDDTMVRVSFPTPTGPVAKGTDLQEFRIQARETGPGTTADFDVELWENGVLVSALTVTPFDLTTTPAVFSVTWDAALLSDPSGADVECRCYGNGDNAGTFSSVEFGAIEWNAEYILADTVELGLATETNTALSLSPVDAVVLGLASATGIGLPMLAADAVILGLATETDTALPLLAADSYPFGLATETNTAFPLTLAAEPIGPQNNKRAPIMDFQLPNPLFADAKVYFYPVDILGNMDRTELAPLYANMITDDRLANPQTLDGEGKWRSIPWIDRPVRFEVVGQHVKHQNTQAIHEA